MAASTTVVPTGAVWGPLPARATRIIDGDTLVALVELPFNVRRDLTVRLYGVNAPEAHKPGGPEATDYLRGLLPPDVPLLLAGVGRDMSFARYVCDVWVEPAPGAGWAAVSDLIIATGHGVPFDPKVDKWTP